MPEQQEKENKFTTELRELITYSVSKLLHSKETQYNEISEPIIKYIQEYDNTINRENADNLFKPICWYLSDKKILDFVQTGKHGTPDYWKLNKQKAVSIEKIVNGILKGYGETLQARFDRIKHKGC